MSKVISSIEPDWVIPYPPSSKDSRKSPSISLRKSPSLIVSVFPIGIANESPPKLASILIPLSRSSVLSIQEVIRKDEIATVDNPMAAFTENLIRLII